MVAFFVLLTAQALAADVVIRTKLDSGFLTRVIRDYRSSLSQLLNESTGVDPFNFKLDQPIVVERELFGDSPIAIPGLTGIRNARVRFSIEGLAYEDMG